MAPSSPPDLEALRAAFAVLLSPLDAIDIDSWRGEVARTLCELTGADNAAFELDYAGGSRFHSEDYPQAALDAYAEHYHAVDIGRTRRDELGLPVWNRDLLHGERIRQFRESVIHRDFLLPNGILDSMGMTFAEAGQPDATLFLHSERAGRPEFGQQGLALLELLLPAFKAGVRDVVRFGQQHQSLTAHLDSLTDGIRVTALNGTVIHQNPKFTSRVGGPGGEELEAASVEVAQSLSEIAAADSAIGLALASHRIARQVKTHAGDFRVHGSYLGRELLGAEHRIAISLVRSAPATALSDATLQEKFGLTAREVEVARRIAHGESTKEIAAACVISLHTVRSHSERIFAKLGVRSRSRVGPKLRGA